MRPRTMRLVAFALLVAAAGLSAASLAACSGAPPVPVVAVADVDRPALLDRTREVVRPHCGTCHTTSSPQAVAEALAIYDLDRADWGAAMSEKQLTTFRRSIARKLEPGSTEQADIDAYVGDLLARARAGPQP